MGKVPSLAVAVRLPHQHQGFPRARWDSVASASALYSDGVPVGDGVPVRRWTWAGCRGSRITCQQDPTMKGILAEPAGVLTGRSVG